MNAALILPASLAARIAGHLDGERMAWAARPSPIAAFVGTLPMWLIGVPWSALTFTIFGTMLAAFWVGPAPHQVVPWWQIALFAVFTVFAGSFAAIGAALLATPFVAAYTAACTIHVITNRRLVTVVLGQRSDTVRTVLPADMLAFSKQVRRNGWGTLTITTGLSRDSDGDRLELREELRSIPDVTTAERLLRALKG